jgi:protein-disulfide isomerase
MRRTLARAAIAAAAATALLALGACQRQLGGDEAFGQRVRAYLLAHPEVIQESAQRLEVKLASDEAAAMRRGQAQLPRLRAAVERDPADFVANPNGRVTVTEFYDYRCPHCVNAAPKVLALIATHPEVRFVFKEMPIFGAMSEHAARAALAVKAAGGDYLGLYQAYMSARPLDDDLIDALARQKGVIAVPAANSHIASTAALFNQLALGGTPAFIVGDQFIYGEDMDAVEAAVAKAAGRTAKVDVASR